MAQITVAPSLDALRGNAEIAHATGWQLAADVWSRTYKAKPGPKRSGGNPTELYSITEFADLKIRGLRHKEEVIRYRSAWQHAIDTGHAKPVEPGDVIELPDIDFPASTGSGSNEPDPPAELPNETPQPGGFPGNGGGEPQTPREQLDAIESQVEKFTNDLWTLYVDNPDLRAVVDTSTDRMVKRFQDVRENLSIRKMQDEQELAGDRKSHLRAVAG